MNLREFATNYLNPIFLFYRAVLLMSAGGMALFSIPLFINNASKNEVAFIIVISMVVSIVLVKLLWQRPYILYLLIPFVVCTAAFTIRGNDSPQLGILWIPIIMWISSAILVAWNGIRSWGYGVSINDINDKLDNN